VLALRRRDAYACAAVAAYSEVGGGMQSAAPVWEVQRCVATLVLSARGGVRVGVEAVASAPHNMTAIVLPGKVQRLCSSRSY